MIQAIVLDEKNICLKYIGYELDRFKYFFNLVVSFKGKANYDLQGWEIDKEFLSTFEKQFDIEFIYQPYIQMGEELLLPPYRYQKEAIYYGLNNLNSLMILPPGSGKTPIAIGIYLELLKHNITDKPGVVCVKASLKYQWVKEIQKFSNLRAKAIETPSKAKKKFDSQFEDVDLMVLNYETFKNDKVYEKLREKEVEVIMLDEIHYIGSNHKTAKSKALYKLNDLKVKIGFTATPITRDPENLFSIFNMLNPDLFEKHSKFAKNYLIYKSFGQIAGIKNQEHLKKQIAPYCFIKTEKEIAGQLPKLIVEEFHCEMTKEMIKTNCQIFEKLDELKKVAEKYEKDNTNINLEHDEEFMQIKAQILAHQTFAQELIDDPRLFELSDSKLASNFTCKDKTSPKLDLLLDIIDQILDVNPDNKICIFTKFERMQSILKEEIESKFNTKCAIVNGTQSSQERYKQAYTLFQDDNNYNILIATNAMTEGVSLSKCNILIEYDLAESYAMQTQRHGRIRRASSINKISYVYQLIMDEPNGNSWDQIAQKIVSKKRNYDQNIIQSLKQ